MPLFVFVMENYSGELKRRKHHTWSRDIPERPVPPLKAPSERNVPTKLFANPFSIAVILTKSEISIWNILMAVGGYTQKLLSISRHKVRDYGRSPKRTGFSRSKLKSLISAWAVLDLEVPTAKRIQLVQLVRYPESLFGTERTSATEEGICVLSSLSNSVRPTGF